jgi:glycosyltransferase involved in cell wall biosynthesis
VSDVYRCDAFLPGSPLRGYDLLIFPKILTAVPLRELDRLKAEGTLLVYRATDYHAGRDGRVEEHRAALERMDGILISNPMQREDYRELPAAIEYIGSPIINTRFREEYDRPEVVTILWQGYRENLEPMLMLRPILERLIAETGREVRLVLHTNLPSREDGIVTWLKWRRKDWEKVLARSDIAVVIKPSDDPFQQKKPPSKVISYLAAGIPVVCTPSVSDQLVIEHDRTGFFANDEEEWYTILRALIEEDGLRERIGRAGRDHVLDHYRIEVIADRHLAFFDGLRSRFRNPP